MVTLNLPFFTDCLVGSFSIVHVVPVSLFLKSALLTPPANSSGSCVSDHNPQPLALHGSNSANACALFTFSNVSFHLESLGSEPRISGNEADRKLATIAG